MCRGVENPGGGDKQHEPGPVRYLSDSGTNTNSCPEYYKNKKIL